MNDKRHKGIYNKFRVERTDGDPTGKHADCRYFVLDIDHDPHAVAALYAYADSCAVDGYLNLADDLRMLAREQVK